MNKMINNDDDDTTNHKEISMLPVPVILPIGRVPSSYMEFKRDYISIALVNLLVPFPSLL